jgi:hypothetical protein
MAEFTPEIIPLGSLADAAAASAQLSEEEQMGTNAIAGPGTPILTGYIAP